MEITVNSNTITLSGNVKSVGDFQAIKNKIDDVVSRHNKIQIRIPDSISLTSSVIGYFNKLVLKDNIQLETIVGNPQLLELLRDLKLDSTFNVRKG